MKRRNLAKKRNTVESVEEKGESSQTEVEKIELATVASIIVFTQ